MKKLIRFLVFIIVFAGIAVRIKPFLSGLIGSSGSGTFTQDSGQPAAAAADSQPVSDFPDHYCYYYNQLSEEEQEVYLEIYAALRDRSEEQKLSTTDRDLMTHVFSLVQLDHPEFFWTDSCKYIVTSNSLNEIKSLSLTPEYTMTESEIEAAQADISDYQNAFLAVLADDSDDWSKTLAAFEWVASNTDYAADAPHNQDMYSAVLGQTVCQGYSTAFKYLCDRMEIPCLIVTGTNETGGAHSWNMACLNGSWCSIDCTYGDTAVLDFDIDYSWFGISDDLIQKERTCTDADLLPEGDQGQNGYFYRKALWQDTYNLDELKTIVKGDTLFGLSFASDSAYEEACQDLFDHKNVQELGEGSTFTYVPEDLSRTVYIQITE